MKKLILAFFLILQIFSHSVYASDSKFVGEWLYGRDKIGRGGNMIIKDCTDNKCKVEFVTINGAHTCELENTDLIIFDKTANINIDDYYTKNCKISLTLKSENILNIDSNDNCSRLCGMSGHFIGEWQNKNKPATYTAGFDCHKAKTELEITICQNKDLAELDKEMTIIYKAANGQKELQKKWMTKRNSCKNEKNCLINIYEIRIKELVSIINKKDFNLYDYAYQLSENNYFHPNDAILIENFIKEKIGDNEYEKFISCSNRETDHIIEENKIFTGYGCPGLFTIMESAIYIDKTQIWLSYLDNDEITTYGPKNKDIKDFPAPLSNWIKDLKDRSKNRIKSGQFFDNL